MNDTEIGTQDQTVFLVQPAIDKKRPGKYLKETSSKRKPNRRKKRRNFRKYRILLACALLVISVVLVCSRCFGEKDMLEGTWSIDGVTSYQFNGHGEGKLLLPDKAYDFFYTIKDDTLSIDFKSNTARDFSYRFQVSGEKLTLVGGEGNEDITYVLQKQEP